MTWYALEDIWMSWTVKQYKRPFGCVVMVQKVDTPNLHHWHLWHTPLVDTQKVLQTAPNDWTDWGWWDDVTNDPVKEQKNKAKAKGEVKAKSKAKAKLCAGT